MIAFASLFLGLVFGMRPVEIVVGQDMASQGSHEVAMVEIRLNDQLVSRLDRAPWIADCDFGAELTPHHLEAIAFDSEGREVSRIEQWLNLPQASAVLTAVLEPTNTGGKKGLVALLSWESSVGAEPKSVTAVLDGVAIPVQDPRRIPLLAVDSSQFHLLSIEMKFENYVRTRVDLTFGGSYADNVSSEMTAIPIVATKKTRKGPTLESVSGWFSRKGEELRVVAVEKEKMEIVFVMDRPFANFFLPGERVKIPKSLNLTDEHRIRFVASVPSQSQGVRGTFELFPISRAYGPEVESLYRLLTGIGRTPMNQAAQPAAAVAVAGLAAYESRRRRAVVLVPSERPSEDSLSPAQVQRYLEDLRVPLFIWEPESKPSGRFTGWGRVRSTGNLEQLADAFGDLEQELSRHWIVWIDGKHLPQEIELSDAAKGFILAR